MSSISAGKVCDTSLSYSQIQASIPSIKKYASTGKITCTMLQPQDRTHKLASLCTVSTLNTIPITGGSLHSLLLDTPSFRALMDSDSATSFPERRFSDEEEDSYDGHLNYLLQRSAQLMEHRMDGDLFQHKTELIIVRAPPDADDEEESSASDSSSQAEYGSRGSMSQESDPELESVLTTYYAPPRTVASLVTLPSLHKASLPNHPLCANDTLPTIPSDSIKSDSLKSLESIEEAHRMIWQLEAIATELKAIDNNTSDGSNASVPSLARIQASSSSTVPPSPIPTIPLPPLPSTPSPLLPSPWSMKSLAQCQSRPSILKLSSETAHSLAYLQAPSTPNLSKQAQQQQLLFTGDEEVSLPHIVVTEPSVEDILGEGEGEMGDGSGSMKDATLLMDLVEDCYGDAWNPGKTLAYRTQTTVVVGGKDGERKVSNTFYSAGNTKTDEVRCS